MNTPTTHATMRFRLWFEDKGQTLLGRGRVQLLARIHELGSLNKAAKSLGMSYRSAWGRLKDSEEALGQPLVVDQGGRKGFRLSEFGIAIVEAYAEWTRRVEDCALAAAKELFPWDSITTKSRNTHDAADDDEA